MKLRTRQTGGQALVEFAFVVPVLLTVVLGLGYFGFLLYAHVQVTNAAREGARAGSLYLGGRFHYTSCETGQPCRNLPWIGYGNGGGDRACWTLQDWIENGLAERNRDSNGCPATGFNTTGNVHSFGLLNPAKCDPAASNPTNCWSLTVTAVTEVVDTKTLPVAGSELRVRVIYRYPRAVVADYIGLTQNPILIDKTVLMKVQNN